MIRFFFSFVHLAVWMSFFFRLRVGDVCLFVALLKPTQHLYQETLTVLYGVTIFYDYWRTGNPWWRLFCLCVYKCFCLSVYISDLSLTSLDLWFGAKSALVWASRGRQVEGGCVFIQLSGGLGSVGLHYRYHTHAPTYCREKHCVSQVVYSVVANGIQQL